MADKPLTQKQIEQRRRAHEAHQTRMRHDERFAGLLTIAEAAAIVGVTPQAISQRIRRHTLPAIKGRPGRTSEYWISPVALSTAYPQSKRKAAKARHIALTNEQVHAVIGADATNVGDPDELLAFQDLLHKETNQ